MKALLISFIVILIVSSALESFGLLILGMSYPDYPIPAGITRVEQGKGTGGTRRREMQLPGIKISDGFRPVLFMETVDDNSPRKSAEFPFGGNN